MKTIDLEIEVNDEPLNVTVDYEYYPVEPELWSYPNGDPGHPGSGPEVDVLSIQDERGNTVPDALINSKWSEYIIDKCIEDSEGDSL